MSKFNDDAILQGQFALQKIDDLMNRVDVAVERWPRLYKNNYGVRLYALLSTMEEMCVAASKKYHKKTTLQEMDIKNAQVRIHIRRLARTSYTDRQGRKRMLLTPGQHEEWVKINVEIGRIIGGWIKQQNEAKA